MKDHDFIKKILQEQEVKLPNVDFTNQIMQHIVLQEERKKRFYQIIWFVLIFGLVAWMYMVLKPYFKELLQPIMQVWKMQYFGEYLSLPYLICYVIVILSIGYLVYDEQNHIFKKV